MAKIVTCQCGETIRGDNDDDIFEKVKLHAKDAHGGMQITREQVLAMAKPE
jgi:predicted small metal-binding protein